MKYKHTNRPGFLLGAIDFCTAGIFFLFYMSLSVEPEINEILKKKVQPYWMAYLLGTFNFFFYTLYWMAKICEETKNKAIELGLKPHTSFKHMMLWNILGLLVVVGPAVATHGYFKTLNEIEKTLNAQNN